MTTKDTILASSGGKSLEARGPAVYMTMMVFLVLAFLVHLERMEEKEADALAFMEKSHSVVSAMRIDQCHAIQSEALDVIKKHTESSLILAESLGDWQSTLSRIEATSVDNSKSLHEIIMHLRNPQKRSTYVE